MFRALIAAFHIGFAGWLAITGWILLSQAALGRAWEAGFYPNAWHGSDLDWLAALERIIVAACEITVAGGFAFGQRWAIPGMIGISVLLAVIAPWPVWAFMALAAVHGVIELIPERVDEDEEEEE